MDELTRNIADTAEEIVSSVGEDASGPPQISQRQCAVEETGDRCGFR